MIAAALVMALLLLTADISTVEVGARAGGRGVYGAFRTQVQSVADADALAAIRFTVPDNDIQPLGSQRLFTVALTPTSNTGTATKAARIATDSMQLRVRYSQ